MLHDSQRDSFVVENMRKVVMLLEGRCDALDCRLVDR